MSLWLAGCQEDKDPDLWRAPGSDAEARAELVRLRSPETRLTEENLSRQIILCFFMEKPEISIMACDILETFHDNIKDLGKIFSIALTHSRPSVRSNAIRTIGLCQIRGFEGLIRKAASDHEENVRVTAIQALGKLKDKDSRFLFLLTLKDNSWRVRSEAATALMALEDPSTLKYILRAIPDSDEFTEMQLEDAFLAVSKKDPVGKLQYLFKQVSARQRLVVALALADQSAKDGMALLEENLKKDKPWREEQVRLVLEKLKMPDLNPAEP